MTENEQVQEVARTICGLNTDKGCFCDGGYCNYNCLAYEKAKTLYAKGYRKASEVAREIIADFREMIKGYENIDVYLDRIEKKYGGDSNDGE